MFDHCHSENINSHSQNRCFKKLTKSSPKGSGCLRGGGGVEKVFGQNPFEQHLSFHGASLMAAKQLQSTINSPMRAEPTVNTVAIPSPAYPN